MSKLYTKEQMIQAYELGRGLTHEEVMEQFVPIQLPTDEEIENEAEDYADRNVYNPVFAFDHGAKWMRDKIQGGQDE